MRRIFVIIGVSFAVLLSFVNADAQDVKQVESELKTAFEGKQLQLKIPYVEDKLHFDATGRLLGNSQIGPLSGAQHNRPAPKFVSLVTEQSIRITVDLPDNTENAVKQSLGQVFLGGDLQSRLAGCWTPEVDIGHKIASMPKGEVIGVLEGKRPVYRAGSGSFRQAKPVYTPDPSYPPEAKKQRIVGTVVIATVINEAGFPELLAPTHRTIEGFDEKALSAISKWRFQPATMDGKPVAVFVQVEVSFRTN